MWNSNRDSFWIFQARIHAWFESPSVKGVTNFTETLPVTELQSSLVCLCLMSSLLPHKVLSILLRNPAYKRYRFRMWVRILERYDPRCKYTLFESVSALYTLEQVEDETISAYMNRARSLFSSLHGVNFNTIVNLFIIVKSDRSQFGSLANHFFSGNPGVVNVGVNRLKTLLEAIESCSHVLDGQPTLIPSALRGSAPCSDPTPASTPNDARLKTPAPLAGTKKSYPHMRPKWDEVSDLAKSDKVYCAYFCAHMRAQGCVPLAHSCLFIGNDPEGEQHIIAVYAEKKKTLEEAKKNNPPQSKGPTRHLLVQVSSPSHPRHISSPNHRPP